MTLRCRFAAALLSAALAATPLAPRAQLAPFAGKPSPSDLVETEDRVWGAADELDRAMRRQGSLYRDAALDGYLADLLHRLFPEFVGAMRVRVVDSPQMNAFALPNGSIYLNLGLVARLHDDAQLAAVLAHEGGHFVHRHGFQQRETAKNAAAFGLGLGLLIGGLGGLLVQGLTASSVFGFSRDLEREADRVAFDRMRRAGFDTRAGVRVFEAMRDEAQVLALPQPV
ncbi:MAG TPA: M48 family metallopeptidase, partial [Burkholderiaceae bacterium]|nr:M48 family metallopeptidase [Burkholderiaceae bacterium]